MAVVGITLTLKKIAPEGSAFLIVGKERVEAMLAAERRLAEAGRLTDVE